MKVKAGSSKNQKKATGMTPTKDQSVRVEKIENGFIVTKSGSDKTGKYHETKVFSETNPLEGI